MSTAGTFDRGSVGAAPDRPRRRGPTGGRGAGGGGSAPRRASPRRERPGVFREARSGRGRGSAIRRGRTGIGPAGSRRREPELRGSAEGGADSGVAGGRRGAAGPGGVSFRIGARGRGPIGEHAGVRRDDRGRTEAGGQAGGSPAGEAVGRGASRSRNSRNPGTVKATSPLRGAKTRPRFSSGSTRASNSAGLDPGAAAAGSDRYGPSPRDAGASSSACSSGETRS